MPETGEGKRIVTDRIRIEVADITRLCVDAVVNAANDRLAPGGGVDGAIRRAAGPALTRATAALGGCPTGEAVVTGGFGLPAQFVIHTAGPVWAGGEQGEGELLARCYRAVLTRAVEIGARTVAFPAISTGVYGFPADLAAEIATREAAAFLDGCQDIESVVLVAFDAAAVGVLAAALRRTVVRSSTGRR